MSDSNNSNSGIDYSKYEISTTTWIVSGIFFIICMIILSIISTNESIQYKSIYIILFVVLPLLITIGYISNEFFHKKNLLERAEKDEQEKERQQELEANAYCKMNPDVCMHNGTCQNTGSDLQQYTCDCTNGWKGKNCNVPNENTIKSSDIDDKCSDPSTGEKKVGLEWCNANFDGKGGKCVSKDNYQIECPVNRDGSQNYKYNEYGCDIDNDEVWCPETTSDQTGKCIIRSNRPGSNQELCNTSVITQDCLGNDDLVWHSGKQTCVPDCQKDHIFNINLNRCIQYNCSQYNSSATTCNNAPNCKYNNNNKCIVDRSKTQCQSMDRLDCQDSTNCIWNKNLCYNNDGSDCDFLTNTNYCKKLPKCSVQNGSCIKTGTSIPDDDGFTVGGRIKREGFKVKEGFIVGGLSDI